MEYFVTFGGGVADGRPAPVGIDPGLSLADALAHAHQLLAEGQLGVTISDARGHAINGDALVECCNGDKELTADLRAVPR